MFKGDSEIISTIIIGSSILLTVGVLFVVLLLAYRNRNLRHQKQILQLQSKYQQEILQTQLEIQEHTFKTISQEIHDNIGQMLSLAKLNLTRIDPERLGADQEKLTGAENLVTKAIQDLRDLSRTLNTETVGTIGLLKAIEAELNLLRKTGAVEADFEIQGIPLVLEPQKELVLFRICQEALHNVIKHALASVIHVVASFENRCFKLVIRDNGRGFDLPVSNCGSGLRNMRNRSGLIGATCDVISQPNSGTQIIINLPLTQ